MDRAASNQRSSQSWCGMLPFGGSSSSSPRSSGWSASDPPGPSSQLSLVNMESPSDPRSPNDGSMSFGAVSEDAMGAESMPRSLERSMLGIEPLRGDRSSPVPSIG